MSRTAQSSKIKILVVSLLIVVAGGGAWVSRVNTTPQKTATDSAVAVAPVPQKTVNVKYQGEEGKTALELLKTHAKVQTKTSSFGDYVTSVNDNDGGGTKYWIFYVNGKESEVGAGAYVTRATDNIEWKLQ